RRLGYMPDTFGTFPGLSCTDYLEFFGRIYGLHGRHLEERVRAVLDLTDLGGVRDELTSALSMGMKQRLSLAKTLLHDPDILVLDEPASGLDPRARIEIRSLLKELGKMGKTIVISSHILADLEEICSSVGILEEGRVVWHGHLRDAVETTVDTPARVRLRVDESDVERAEALLEKLDLVSNLKRDGDRFEAETRSGRTNDVLQALIEARIEILAFNQAKVDLESIFLHRTRGIVS
ncbi:MAG TPA: ABC transporter ATP-binding protein, partial [Planctomycetota bacterium]|nr:ABC transporter ATP-binding protein [Planctomycetota bacterium]